MGSCKEKREEPAKRVWVNGPIIIGAGPSGLAASASLSEHGVPSMILEGSNCIASLWQHKPTTASNSTFPNNSAPFHY
ncbi:hypothetical protein FH972_017248 [Carpinus fangiana]|uniref:indole-3-pyruvate monooxygenase n=1 Tax=Carpinus fangiana TaxID=176857 RepID=A0A5N6RIL8_9ROSI|nr:hypothetical protein FH972_017248 [Carpinus fangiana]